MFVW
jgi:hypothetical protein